jgi:heat-inducible transcriptional repressor
MLTQLDTRSREVFRTIVDAYVDTGEPIGSRTLSRRLGMSLSPATIRNVMADLEDAGLLAAPHTSAGRLPTEAGLRLFVHGLLEVGSLTAEERASIDTQCAAGGRSVQDMLEEATRVLSGLSSCAGLVVAPKHDTATLRHIEFVPLGPGRALVVIVSEQGLVENRVIDLPPGLPMSTLVTAGNYLTTRIAGRTVDEARAGILEEIDAQRAELDELTARVVAAGLATWSGAPGAGQTPPGREGRLIVRGQANLLGGVTALADLERIRALFEMLETRDGMVRLLDAAQQGEGVQIYIGADSALFGLSGCTVMVAPYTDARDRIVGAIGVIGPTRMNYARIIPMVDYTAKLIGRLLR